MKTIYLLAVLAWTIVVHFFGGEQGIVQRVMSIVMAPIVMGFVVATWRWITGKGFSDLFSWIVLCVSLSLLIVWVALLLPTEFGFGSGEDTVGKLIVIALLLLSIFVGIVYGAVTWRLRHPDESDATTAGEAPLPPVGTSKDSLVASRSKSGHPCQACSGSH